MTQNENNDYNSKVSKLLNSFNNEDDNLTFSNLINPVNALNTYIRSNRSENEKIIFVQEQRNENVLVNLTNDQTYLIEINKKSLDLNLGEKILQYAANIFNIESSANNNLNQNLNNDTFAYSSETYKDIAYKPKEKVKPKISTKKFTTLKEASLSNFQTNNLLRMDNFNSVVYSDKLKIPKLGVTYRELFYNNPRCDICDNVGITIDELKRMPKQNAIDAIVLNYAIYNCSMCKSYVHKNCLNEKDNQCDTTKKKIPILPKDKLNSFNWTCDKCSKVEHSTDILCKICLKTNKKSNLLTELDNNYWVHQWCLLWFRTVNEGNKE